MVDRSEKIRFPSAAGVKLAARLDRPVSGFKACALFAHCFTCSKDLRSVRRLSSALVERGFAVLRFDFTGLGESEGDFADTNFTSNLEDLVAAADYLRQELEPPKLLIGHSLGGAAVLAVAPRVPESVAVATIGAPSDPAHLQTSFFADADFESQEEAEVSIGGRPFRIRRQLLEDLSQHELLSGLRGLRRALLIMHSPFDKIVGVDHARILFEAARHPKSFVSLDGADHLLFESPRDAVYVGEVLSAWAGRYVLDPSEVEHPPALEPGVVEVEGGAVGFAQTVRVSGHVLSVDEPRALGGTDTGPGPYDLLLAALGSCTSMTLRSYADRKGWPLAGTKVRLSHSRVHARDCAECESDVGRVDLIDRHLELEGDLSSEQEERLREIASKCPVHRTLTSETRIRDV